MRKLLLTALSLSLLPLPSLSHSLKDSVYTESKILLECSLNKISCETLLDIPWDEPAFQFWLSYYKNRWNKLKLLSQVDSFKLFYPKIVEIFRKEGIPADLALLSIVESQGNPSAVSKAGAAGLWQLMPSTARRLGLKVNWLIDERFDPIKSTKAAAKYLKELYSTFHRWDLAIAAYNAGPGRIKTRLKKLGNADFWDLTKLPDETLNYVPKFYAVLSVVKGSNILRNGSKETLVTIKVKSRTTLRRIARALNVRYSTVRKYNRIFRRNIVPPNYYIYLPSKSIRNYHILKYAESKKIFIYVPKRRETITLIARKFGVNPKLIREINRLRNNRIYFGKPIIIVKLGEKGRDGKS
jgi:membrane-bound lytic murein transglycosylase D